MATPHPPDRTRFHVVHFGESWLVMKEITHFRWNGERIGAEQWTMHYYKGPLAELQANAHADLLN